MEKRKYETANDITAISDFAKKYFEKEIFKSPKTLLL